MNTYRILIIDQDNSSIAHLKDNLRTIGHRVVGIAKNAPQAVRMYRRTRADFALIGLDAESAVDRLQLGTLFKKENIPFSYVINQLTPKLLTAANRTQPHSYISRPCRIGDLSASIAIAMHARQPATDTSQHIFIDKSESIQIDDILFIQAEHVYTRIFLSNGRSILQRQSLKTILDRLPSKTFIQSHRSYVVPIEKVEHMKGAYLSIQQHCIPVSRNRRKMVQQCLKERAKIGMA
ncbi:MAG: LytTR family transcriptional regulator DNA-binding domain-containing protein [Bacteroidota bacterium]